MRKKLSWIIEANQVTSRKTLILFLIALSFVGAFEYLRWDYHRTRTEYEHSHAITRTKTLQPSKPEDPVTLDFDLYDLEFESTTLAQSLALASFITIVGAIFSVIRDLLRWLTRKRPQTISTSKA